VLSSIWVSRVSLVTRWFKSDRPEYDSKYSHFPADEGIGLCRDFNLLEKVAENLGPAVGASRAAVGVLVL